MLLLISLFIVLVVLLPAMTVITRDPHAELLYLAQEGSSLLLSIEWSFTDDYLALLLKNISLQDNEISLFNSLRRFRNPTNPRASIS